MKTSSSSCPAWLANLYGAILYLYPKSFREDYREQMLQVFIDNYRRHQRSNSAVFIFDTLNDLGASMSQEHFSSFSKRGRIRIAILGLCFALGFLTLRPFLTESLTDGLVFIGDFDQEIDTLLYADYAEHRQTIAQDLLDKNDPMSVLAGARTYNDLSSDANLKTRKALNLRAPLEQALKGAARDANVWIAAYPACVANPDTCNAEKVLDHLQTIAPENGSTWLYSAAAASKRGDLNAQETHLSKANESRFFDDSNNLLNARLHDAYARNPYELPWYSFIAKENHGFAMSFVIPIEDYAIPGCSNADKSVVRIQMLCRDIAKRIAAQPSSSLSARLQATSLAVRLGASELKPERDLLSLQSNSFFEASWKANLVSPGELAKAYADGKQYDLAVQTVKKYQMLDKSK